MVVFLVAVAVVVVVVVVVVVLVVVVAAGSRYLSLYDSTSCFRSSQLEQTIASRTF